VSGAKEEKKGRRTNLSVFKKISLSLLSPSGLYLRLTTGKDTSDRVV
jgi:hypothetical protein